MQSQSQNVILQDTGVISPSAGQSEDSSFRASSSCREAFQGSFISVDCWHQKHRMRDEEQRRGVEGPSTSLEVVVREQAASHIFRAFSLCPRSLKHCQRENKTHTRWRWDKKEEGARGKHSPGRWTSVAHIHCSLHRCAKSGKFDRLLSIFHHWALSGPISATALECSHSFKDLCIVWVLFPPIMHSSHRLSWWWQWAAGASLNPFLRSQGSKPPPRIFAASAVQFNGLSNTWCFSNLQCNITC